MSNLANFKWPTASSKPAVTIDAKDERIKGAHHASEAAARDIPSTAHKAKAWRVRLTVTAHEPVTAEVIRRFVSCGELGSVKVSRIKEVI